MSLSIVELEHQNREMRELLEHWNLYGTLDQYNGKDNYRVYKRTSEITGYQLWTNIKIRSE